MSSEPLISLHQAGYHSGSDPDSRRIVEQVSLAVHSREIVTLIGPNGSGKSTTARLALGILKPTSGTTTRKRGLRIGYVPQKLSIDWTVPLKVARFMTLTSRIKSQRVVSALERTGVARLLNSDMQALSGGEFQRVLLARAIASSPDLLVLDEPVQGVDFNGQLALYQLIGDIREEIGCGVLLISHDLHLVMAATDKVICLNGHVCCSGSPSSVAVSPEYQALFGASAAATLAIYEHHHDHTHLPDGRVQFSDDSNGSAATGSNPNPNQNPNP